MADHRSQQTLLEDLEAIRNSLDKGPEAQSIIPTLEDIVGQRAPTSVNLKNPFLSSNSLSELLRIRNDAESVAAQELSELKPLWARAEMTDSQSLADWKLTSAPGLELEAESELEAGLELESEPKLEPLLELEVMPDPNLIIGQMEQLLASWIEDSVTEHMVRFESELRSRLQQDFDQLITHWYQEQGLELPANVRTRLSLEQPTEAASKPSIDDAGFVP